MKRAGMVIEIAREQIKGKVALLAKWGRCSRNCRVPPICLGIPRRA